MFRELSEVLYGSLRLRWKASSLKLMTVHPEPALPSAADLPHHLVVPATWLGPGPWACSFAVVTVLDVLGTRLASTGCNLCPFAHCSACGYIALGRHRALLRSKEVAVKERMQAHMSAVEASVLFGSETWSFSKTLLTSAAADGKKRLRTTCRLWARTQFAEPESRMAHLERTVARLR